MKERSYRLAQYEIVLESNGGIWWKAHGGFADAKSGKCFIEGNVLFLGPSEENEPGCLKTSFSSIVPPVHSRHITVKFLHGCEIFSHEDRSHSHKSLPTEIRSSC